MTDAYAQLLDAAIRHLESLKASGKRFVAVSPQVLSDLEQPARRILAKTATPPPLEIPMQTKNETRAAKPVSRGFTEDRAPTLPAAAPKSETTPAAPQLKQEKMADLRRRALACAKCAHLASSRKNVVFGVGNPDAELMFVGEAPGADEDIQGEPFVGRAGELLTKIIQAMGLTRDSVYIANILKCRPDMPPGASGNRKPTPEEMQTCIPFLHEQIDLIQPKVLVGLGGTAIEGLLGKTAGITRLRGTWQTYRNIPLMPTYHPAYLLRNQALQEKRRVWEDMLQVMERLGLQISAKQRAYFSQGAS